MIIIQFSAIICHTIAVSLFYSFEIFEHLSNFIKISYENSIDSCYICSSRACVQSEWISISSAPCINDTNYFTTINDVEVQSWSILNIWLRTLFYFISSIFLCYSLLYVLFKMRNFFFGRILFRSSDFSLYFLLTKRFSLSLGLIKYWQVQVLLRIN